MEETQAIVESMLNKLVEIGEKISWKINNSYADGIDQTILEIRIYQKGFQSGRIAYHAEGGQVLSYSYKDLEKRKPIEITDMLLDIISLELAIATETSPSAV